MSAFFTTSFPTTNLGDQAQTKRLISDAVVSPAFYQPTAYLGTKAAPVNITLSNSLNYIQGINKYVFHVFYIGTGGVPPALVTCQVINCPPNLLDTFSAITYNNFYAVPIGQSIQEQSIFDCAQLTPTIISSSINLLDNIVAAYQFKMIISLTPESG